MISRRRAIDRRANPRFEVVGDLSGTLELVRPLRLLNVGMGGALVQSDRPWEVGSVHSVMVGDGVDVGSAQIRVKHVRLAEGSQSYLIGLEFLALTAALAAQITKWVELPDSIAGEG